MAISKDRFREAVNEFYSKEVLFKLYTKYFLDWIAEGYIGSNLGLFEISLISENSNKQTFIDLIEQFYSKEEIFCTIFETLNSDVKKGFEEIAWNGKFFISTKEQYLKLENNYDLNKDLKEEYLFFKVDRDIKKGEYLYLDYDILRVIRRFMKKPKEYNIIPQKKIEASLVNNNEKELIENFKMYFEFYSQGGIKLSSSAKILKESKLNMKKYCNISEYYEDSKDLEESDEFNSISSDEEKGLKWAGYGFIVSFLIIGILSVPSWGPLRNPTTGMLLLGWSPLLSAIVPVICLIFFIPGLFYGIGSKKIKNDKDLMNLLFKALDGFGAFIVLCFFSSIFISWFSYSQFGTIIAAEGGKFLAKIGLTGIPLMIVFIFFVSFINLFMGSMTSKYVLLAPIFLPMLYKMGISPELAQLAYRLGDSATNIISPLMSYFALVLMYCNKYNKKFGLGDLITYMIPHSISILISSIIFFGIWLALNLPIGFGTVNFL